MIRRLALSMLLAGSAAAAPQPTDFAWGMPLTVDTDKPLQQLSLPASVYGSAVQADLGDLRVFNGTGVPVPHTLLPPARPDADVSWQAVPLFPLPASAAVDDNLAVQVRTDAGGAVVQVERRNAPATDAAPPRVWLIDLSRQHKQADRLRLRWRADVQPFATTVELASSDSLDRWQPQPTATVAELAHGDHRLRRDELALAQPARYLRLSAPAPLALEAVEVGHATAGALPWQWQPATISTATADGVIFDAQGRWPTSRLQLDLPSVNQLVELEIASAATAAGPWHQHGSHRFHRLRLDGAELRNDAMPLQTRSDRYWRLRGAGAASLAGARLQLGWLPHQLLFLQQGDPPFTLAYGSGRVAAAEAPLPVLLRTPSEDAGMIAVASAGAPIELGGSEALLIPHVLPWQRIGLWALLLAVVAMLGWMAWRLIADLNTARRDSDVSHNSDSA